MRTRNTQYETKTISTFKLIKVMTVLELSKILKRSVITIRRRLKEWGAYTSYNKNGRYYTLPSIPKFNKKGIWQFKNILFSKQGTLKNTIVYLVRTSFKGLTNSELAEIIKINPHSFMPQYKELPELRKEKYKREVIYFSEDEERYTLQKENRFPPQPSALQLPPDAISIIILVELIHNPGMNSFELAKRLHKKGYKIEQFMIDNFFEHYNLGKKKLNIQ